MSELTDKSGWACETMMKINDLTKDIQGKAFDPDWFLLRNRLEEMEHKLAASEAAREKAKNDLQAAVEAEREVWAKSVCLGCARGDVINEAGFHVLRDGLPSQECRANGIRARGTSFTLDDERRKARLDEAKQWRAHDTRYETDALWRTQRIDSIIHERR